MVNITQFSSTAQFAQFASPEFPIAGGMPAMFELRHGGSGVGTGARGCTRMPARPRRLLSSPNERRGQQVSPAYKGRSLAAQLQPIGVAFVLGFAPALIARWKRRRMTPWYLCGLVCALLAWPALSAIDAPSAALVPLPEDE